MSRHDGLEPTSHDPVENGTGDLGAGFRSVNQHLAAEQSRLIKLGIPNRPRTVCLSDAGESRGVICHNGPRAIASRAALINSFGLFCNSNVARGGNLTQKAASLTRDKNLVEIPATKCEAVKRSGTGRRSARHPSGICRFKSCRSLPPRTHIAREIRLRSPGRGWINDLQGFHPGENIRMVVSAKESASQQHEDEDCFPLLADQHDRGGYY